MSSVLHALAFRRFQAPAIGLEEHPCTFTLSVQATRTEAVWLKPICAQRLEGVLVSSSGIRARIGYRYDGPISWYALRLLQRSI